MSLRSRQRLALHKIDEFAAFCETQGFSRVDPKAWNEALRMTKPGSEPLIVHKRDSATVHATTWGLSARMFDRWMSKRRSAEVSA